MNNTPRGNRLHIGIFGKRNAGKSSLINALTDQEIAIVSDTPGTTADPVFKSMELRPVGPVVFVDTAGFDDEGSLGELRIKKTEEVTDKTDLAVLVIDGETLIEGGMARELREEKKWMQLFRAKSIPVITALNKWETILDRDRRYAFTSVKEQLKIQTVIPVSTLKRTGMDEIRKAIEASVPEDFLRERILGDLIDSEGLALLVMPQDIQAPKGRLILPQVQTIRELLDKRCTAVCTTVDGFDRAVASLRRDPDLIITDSQCFSTVYEKKPEGSPLTSFSVLFAACKGDIRKFVEGAEALDEIFEKARRRREDPEKGRAPRILIAEACTHVPVTEDIGTVKIPNLLRKKFGDDIEIVNVRGGDFPAAAELGGYDLVIHCGACMFNRKHVLNRIKVADTAGVPVTNYGVILAKLGGILDRIEIPGGRDEER